MFFNFSGFGMANDNKHVKMKIVDDKLKIIDDVPTSAVEMAVKEKVCKTREFDDCFFFFKFS